MKALLLLTSLIITFTTYAKKIDFNTNFWQSYISTVDAIGKQEINLQQLPIQILKVRKGKDVIQSVNKQLVLFSENFKTTENFASNLKSSEINKILKNTSKSFESLRRLSTKSTVKIRKILHLRDLIIVNLTSLNKQIKREVIRGLPNIYIDEYHLVSKIEENIAQINHQISTLQSYELQSELNNFDYNNIGNKENIISEINQSINFLILNNLDDLSIDQTLTTIIHLTNYIFREENTDIKNITKDISLLFEGLKDRSILSISTNEKFRDHFVFDNFSDSNFNTPKS